MIQKEQYKELREHLDDLLILLDIPKYYWHWPKLLYTTLAILSDIVYAPYLKRKKWADEALVIVKEIYG